MSSILDRVKNHLRDNITNEKLAVGAALPAPEVLAGRMKCSAGTIRKACIDLANEGILKRVKRRGTVVARKPGKGRVCVLLARDSHTNLLLEGEVYRALAGLQFDVDMVPTALGHEVVEHHCQRLLSAPDAVDCLVVLEPMIPDLAIIEKLSAKFARKVLFHFNNNAALPHMPLVTLDHRKAARDAVEHLLNLGHKRIAVASGLLPGETTWASEWAAQCKDFIEIGGGTFFPFFLARGVEPFGKLLKRERVTAYCAMNDIDAVNTVTFCNELGLRVPRDVSIIGRHDTPWSSECRPQLTSVSMNPNGVAAALANVLSKQLTQAQSQGIVVKVPTELVVRASTGAAR